jgi:hypothetical protein
MLRGRDSLLSPHILLGAIARTDASVSIERRRRLEEEARVRMEALSLWGLLLLLVFAARWGGMAEGGCCEKWAWGWAALRWLLVDWMVVRVVVRDCWDWFGEEKVLLCPAPSTELRAPPLPLVDDLK